MMVEPDCAHDTPVIDPPAQKRDPLATGTKSDTMHDTTLGPAGQQTQILTGIDLMAGETSDGMIASSASAI